MWSYRAIVLKADNGTGGHVRGKVTKLSLMHVTIQLRGYLPSAFRFGFKEQSTVYSRFKLLNLENLPTGPYLNVLPALFTLVKQGDVILGTTDY